MSLFTGFVESAVMATRSKRANGRFNSRHKVVTTVRRFIVDADNLSSQCALNLKTLLGLYFVCRMRIKPYLKHFFNNESSQLIRSGVWNPTQADKADVKRFIIIAHKLNLVHVVGKTLLTKAK